MKLNNYSHGPQGEGTDLIKSILMGDQKETHYENKQNQDVYKPGTMVRKLTIIAETTSVFGAKQKARKAIEMLKKMNQASPVTERDRMNIFNTVKIIVPEPTKPKRKPRKKKR